jgi:hypothetical protein
MQTGSVSVVAIVLVVVMTVIFVVAVLGLHVWGAIQDGREQRRRRSIPTRV